MSYAGIFDTRRPTLPDVDGPAFNELTAAGYATTCPAEGLPWCDDWTLLVMATVEGGEALYRIN